MPPRTTYEKILADHMIGGDLLFIDLHLVHEVTSPQAFDGLRLAGRRVRRPDRTLATADHNVPTTAFSLPIGDDLLEGAARCARPQLRGVRHPLLRPRPPAPGDRARDRPRARRDPARHDDRLRRLAHLDARRVRRARVRHRHERGRAGARHADAASSTRAADARPLRGHAVARRRREGPDPRADRPDRHRRRDRARGRVRGRRDPLALDGRPHDHLQHVDRGRRARRPDRARRDDLRLPRGPPGRAGAVGAGARALGRRTARTRARRTTARSWSTCRRSRRRSRGARTPARSRRSPDACPSPATRPTSARSSTWG